MRIIINNELLISLLLFAKTQHPKEVMLLLRGNRRKDEISIEEFILSPFTTSGKGFASFPTHMLPIDFSIVGTAHSHPSGSLMPSTTDLSHFYGRIMMIVTYPYTPSQVAFYNSKGERLSHTIES
jgi:proteasome lid subunit RPN8/RPN11